MRQGPKQTTGIAVATASLCFAFANDVEAQEGSKPPEAEAVDVTVRGERHPTDVSTISRADADALPGAFGDPFRAVEAEPGVSPLISGLPYFFVRGSPPGNVGSFIDEIPVPILFHAFAGPAVIHPAFIERVDVYRGAYPARYGRFAGGVVAAETTAPSENFMGEAHVSLLDAGAVVAGPFAEQRGHVAVAGQYGLASMLLPWLFVDDTRREYWDYQAYVDYDLSSRDTIGVFGFGAFDFFGSETEETLTSTEFHRVDVRYRRILDQSTSFGVDAVLGIDRTRATAASSLRTRSLRGKFSLRHDLSPSASLTGGADVVVEERDPRFADVNALGRLVRAGERVTWGTFAGLEIAPDPFVVVVPGLRADVFRNEDGTSEVGLDPRVTAMFLATPRLRFNHSLGIAHQPPSSLPPIFPGFEQIGQGGGLQRVVQASSGFEVDLPENITASVTAFDNIFLNMTDPIGTTGELDVNTIDARTQGSAFGIELYVHRRFTQRLGGFLSYTLSRSTRSHDRIRSLSAFDRTHVANLVVSYDLGRRWRAGGRVLWMSGVPTRRGTTEGPIFDGSQRAPGFVRVDARLEKRWLLGEHASWAVYGEVMNASASQEVVARNCNEIRCTESAFGPLVLPNVGIEARF